MQSFSSKEQVLRYTEREGLFPLRKPAARHSIARSPRAAAGTSLLSCCTSPSRYGASLGTCPSLSGSAHDVGLLHPCGSSENEGVFTYKRPEFNT